MNILLFIMFGIGAIMALILIIALFTRKEHYVIREIIINAPRQKVFDYLKYLKNQEEFNDYAKRGERKVEFKGTDGTVGYIYAWKGDKSAGEGEKEITGLVEGKRIDTQIRFVKPMKLSANITMTTESLSENQTKVTWANSGRVPYPLNILIPTMEKGLPKDMDKSLQNLKNILER
jgi:hypothetical protein